MKNNKLLMDMVEIATQYNALSVSYDALGARIHLTCDEFLENFKHFEGSYHSETDKYTNIQLLVIINDVELFCLYCINKQEGAQNEY